MRRDHRTLPRFPCVIGGMKRRAFTLIELLVAIGIIAVIAAIVLPVFARSRERARQSVCLSNERQLGAALLLYAQDSDGGMAPCIESRPPGGASWPQIIFPYVRAGACFACPDANPARDTWHGTGPPRVSYAYNLNVGGILWSSAASGQIALLRAEAAPKTLGQILRPAATVLLTDGGTLPTRDAPEVWPEMDHPTINLGDAENVSDEADNDAAVAAPSARHEGQTNALYADGHVRVQRVESFYVGVDGKGAGEKYPGISPCLDPALGCPD